MKNLIKTTLLVFAMSTTLVLASNNPISTNSVDINEALPTSVISTEAPVKPKHSKVRPMKYSPEQKAKIVELKLKLK
jgi:hypothetical protein